jgi:hypothetical protein
MGDSFSMLNSTLANTAGFTLAIAGIDGIAEAMHSTIGAAVEFYTTMQTGAISMAGTLMSMGKLSGQTMQWNEAIGMSKELMMELSDQALVTGASTQEISDTFRAMLPNALSAKMTIEQTMQLASTLTTTGKAMGLQGNVLVRDVQDLISGNNVQRTKLGVILGLSNADIQEAKNSAGGLFNFLQDRLKGEVQANQNYLDSLEGRFNHLKEAVSRVGGLGMSPLLQSGTDLLTDMANKLVQVDAESKKVTGINSSVVEGLQNAGIVLMHIGEQARIVGQDVSTVAVPAFNLLAAAIELAAQHGATLTEGLVALWAGKKLNAYVTDYRNGLTGAAEAQTFLGKAAAQTRTQMLAQQAAAKSAALSSATSISASRVGSSTLSTAAISRQIVLESALGNAVVSTTQKQANQLMVANQAKTSFTGASQALIAGEKELAIQILQTSATLDAQGAASEMMAARATQAIELIRLGEVELAQQILNTTVATDLQGVSGLESGTKTAAGAGIGAVAQRELAATTAVTTAANVENGVAATVAGAKTVTAGNVARSALSTVLTGVSALIGGWIGLAAAIGYATYKLIQFGQQDKNWNDNHTFDVGGQKYIVDQDGKIQGIFGYGTDGGPQYTRNVDDTIDDDTKNAILDMDKQATEAREEAQREQDMENQKAEMKRGLEMQASIMGDPEMQKLMGGVTGAYTGDEKENAAGGGVKTDAEKQAEKDAKDAEKAAQQAAQANQKYAQIMSENAETIRKANEKVENIIASMDEKILEETGTQYDIDMAKAKKEYLSTIKSINDATVTLKTFSAKDAQRMAGGGSTQQNWIENLLSGDDAITTLTAQKLHLLSQKYYELTGEQPTVTSMHRYGDGSSWHDSGQAFDLSDSNLENNRDLRQQLMEYAKTIGLNPLDEYESENAQYGSYNVHFTDNQSPIAVPDTTATVTEAAQTASAIPQTEMVGVITQACQQLGFQDTALAIAIAAKESGGGNVQDIDPNAYNSDSGAAGMFQITSGQDVMGDDGNRYAISDLYPNYGSDPMQNALAGITMLMDKIKATGDTWAGVAAYNGSGSEAQEYANDVRGIRDSLGGSTGVNLVPMTYTRYTSPLAGQAKEEAQRYRNLQEQKALTDLLIRQRKQKEETMANMTEYEMLDNVSGHDQREMYINSKAQAEINANNDKYKDYYKETGDEQSAKAYLHSINFGVTYKQNSSLRELASTEYDEWKQHLNDMSYIDNDYQSEVDTRQKVALQEFIKYQQDQLDTAELTTADRLKLEQDLISNMKELQELNAKTDWGAGLDQLGRSMKSYQQDIGGALTDGWNSISGTISGVFDNMLTDNESFSERMKNMYIDVANEILNTMMKIIMQGLIMNSIMKIFGFGGSSFAGDWAGVNSSSNAFNSFSSLSSGLGITSGFSFSGAFASGGSARSGLVLVGEEGPELLNLGEPSYVYNARETANMINSNPTAGSSSDSSSSGLKSIDITLNNKSGTEMKATTSESHIDGKKMVVTMLLEAVGTNYLGTRDMLKGAVK